MKRTSHRPTLVTQCVTIIGTVAFLYFAQLYGYVHFHHAHDSDGFSMILSAHPLQIKYGDIHKTSDGDDNHDQQTPPHRENISWEYHRNLSDLHSLRHIQIQSVGLIVSLEDYSPELPCVLQEEIDRPPPKMLVEHPSSLRAPPTSLI